MVETMATGIGWGEQDLSDRAADLAARLPEALAPLARIAYNYRWAWYPRGKEVFRAIDGRRHAHGGQRSTGVTTRLSPL